MSLAKGHELGLVANPGKCLPSRNGQDELGRELVANSLESLCKGIGGDDDGHAHAGCARSKLQQDVQELIGRERRQQVLLENARVLNGGSETGAQYCRSNAKRLVKLPGIGVAGNVPTKNDGEKVRP